MSELQDQAKKRFIIQIDTSLTKGAPGQDGQDGTFQGVLPIGSSDVKHDGQIRATELLDALIDELLHTPVTISSFAPTNNIGTYEKGQALSSLQFSWVIAEILSTQSISGTNVVLPTLIFTDRTILVAFSPDLVTDGTVTLDVDDGLGFVGSTSQASMGLVFTQKMHWGVDAIPGAINSAFILGLPSNSLVTARQATFTVNPSSVGDYIWIAYPTAYGVATILAGGFVGGFEPPVTVSNHLNASGDNSDDYYVYRSTNDNLGSTDIEIQ